MAVLSLATTLLFGTYALAPAPAPVTAPASDRVAEVVMIQPSSSEPEPDAGPPPRIWLPFGLLDRMQLAPPRLSVTTELGGADDWSTTRTTFHAQASTTCDCRLGAYVTIPMSHVLVPEGVDVAAAGGPVHADTTRAWLGTGDIGVFAGGEGPYEQSIYRIGALLPTGSDQVRPQFTSARVGDLVLDLPRSIGVRLSASKMFGWIPLPSDWTVPGNRLAIRADFGVDLARELEIDTTVARPMHVIPRAGLGMLFVRRRSTVSFDSALALDPTDQGDLRTRWSAGVTGRIVRPDGRRSWLQPAVTVAVVRSPEGWSTTLAIDLAASAQPPRHRYAYAD